MATLFCSRADHLSPRLYLGLKELLLFIHNKLLRCTMYYLGIDVSKTSSRCIVLRDDGSKLKSFSVHNDHESFHELTNRLTALGCEQSNLLIGMEATGLFWENLYTFLTNKKFQVMKNWR
jgi:hypothetical protein